MTTLDQATMASIAEACVTECVRQHVGLDRVAMLIEAYDWALSASRTRALPSAQDALEIARRAEPASGGRYRSTPVTFASGGSAASASSVESATERLFSLLDHETDPTEFVHHYLSIHPLADGNGRTAFVLLNWLRGSLLSPLALPDLGW